MTSVNLRTGLVYRGARQGWPYLIQQNGVSKGNLPFGLIRTPSQAALAQLLLQVVGIHHSHNAVQTHTAVELAVHPQG